jgi:hypothetical protein
MGQSCDGAQLPGNASLFLQSEMLQAVQACSRPVRTIVVKGAQLGVPQVSLLFGVRHFFNQIQKVGSTMKIALFIVLSSLLLVSAGCCVIDFLDGKHFDQTNNADRPQLNPGNGSGGSGHSH